MLETPIPPERAILFHTRTRPASRTERTQNMLINNCKYNTYLSTTVILPLEKIPLFQ
jgi:hypothetical protein